MNKKIKCIGYTLLSTGIVVFLYIFLHELGHMIIMLSAGATIIESLIVIISLVLTAFGLGYTIGSNNTKK